MVNSLVSSAAALDSIFAALADPSRRAILAGLAVSERTVGELARPLPMSLPAVSRHLRVLQNAGLVAGRKEGRTRRLHLVPSALGPAEAWIARQRAFWEMRLDSLEKYLAESAEHAESEKPARSEKPGPSAREDEKPRARSRRPRPIRIPRHAQGGIPRGRTRGR